MARLTFTEICTQGALLGQNNATPLLIAIKVKAWLRKHYAAWPWPFLIKQATGIAYTTAEATTGLLVGGASGGLTPQITRIFSPVYFRANGYATRGKAPVRLIVGDDYMSAMGMVDASAQQGEPQTFIALPTPELGLEKMTLTAFPTPDKTYTLAFTYQYLPADLGATEYPVYPNEMTLIQAAKCAALEYDQTNDPVYMQELRVLAEMVAADRSAYGANPSFGDVMQLDSSVFLP